MKLFDKITKGLIKIGLLKDVRRCKICGDVVEAKNDGLVSHLEDNHGRLFAQAIVIAMRADTWDIANELIDDLIEDEQARKESGNE